MEISLVLTNDSGSYQMVMGQFIETSIAETYADRVLAQDAAAAAAISASNAGTSATAASNSETASATSASASASSAAAAAASQTAAAGSASAAASSASGAATSASNAATSESNASTSATSATNSASAAATSASNAAATLANALTKANNLSDVANATTARGNLSAAKSGANSDITALSGLTTALSVAQGGTGAATAAGAITALGAVDTSSSQTIGGTKTFSIAPVVGTAPANSNNTNAASTAYADRAAQQQQSKILGITWSRASNALTLGFSGGSLDFAAASLTSGAPIQNVQVVANSITLPVGATLGATANVLARFALLEFYNGGTPVAGVVNTSGSLNLDETQPVSPTTISAGATSANVMYSASAVSANSPYRVVGYIEITLATPGTYASDPSLARGVGGQILTSLQSDSSGRAYVNYYANGAGSGRVLGTSYFNTSFKNKDITVRVAATANQVMTAIVEGVTAAQAYITPAQDGVMAFTVPPGKSYLVTTSAGGAAINTWSELG